jgi:hypothetical protein
MAKTKPLGATGKERRSAPRIPASKVVPHGSMRLAAGQEVELININVKGGILIRCETMLKPGSYVWLRLDIPGASATLGGYVRRCKIANIKDSKIQYEAGVLLDKPFPLPISAELQKLSLEPLHASLTTETFGSGRNGSGSAAHN